MKHKVRIVNRLGRSNAVIMLARLFRNPEPYMLSIHITNRCNLRCSYCYESSYPEKRVTNEQLLNIVRAAKQHHFRSISFLGGEPLLEPDFVPLFEYAVHQGFTVKIFTNGTIVSEVCFARLRRYRKEVTLVVKYDCANSYRDTIGEDISSLVHETIVRCTELRIPVVTLITVTKKNAVHIGEIVKRALLFGTHPMLERHIPMQSPSLALNKDEWNASLDSYYRTLEHHFSLSHGELAEYHTTKARLRGYYCPSFSCSLSINIDGTVVPCAIAPPALSIGNILHDDFGAILKKYRLMKSQWSKIPKSCTRCSNATICRGGCKLHTFLTYGTFDARDPLCERTFIPLING